MSEQNECEDWRRRAKEKLAECVKLMELEPEPGDFYAKVLELRESVTTDEMGFSSMYLLMVCQDEDGNSSREKSYRRGFHHGYDTCTDHQVAGHDQATMSAYCQGLYEWRRDDTDKMVPPPAIRKSQ